MFQRQPSALDSLGVRSFSLFFDDIDGVFRHPADAVAFPSVAAAHADVCNRVCAWLRGLDPACRLSMCPTDYYGVAPFSRYLWELGEQLSPCVDVFYTGPAVCAGTITVCDARAFAAALRRPPIIWDNYPVNDLAMKGELHLGPVRGRDPGLWRATRGVVVNPMLQPEASKIALATYAECLADPATYDPDAAWGRALAALVCPPSRVSRSAHCTRSCTRPTRRAWRAWWARRWTLCAPARSRRGVGRCAT